MEDFFDRLMQRWRHKNSLSRREILANIRYNRWQREKEILAIDQEIKNERYEIKNSLKRDMPTFAKLFLIFLFVNFSLIELFTAWVTVRSFSLAYATGIMPDFTPLVTLIGAVIGQTLTYGFYSSKSKAENTEGGIVFESAMYGLRNENKEDNSDDAVG